MKRILYLPLDERPCNYWFPQMEVSVRQDVELVCPPLEILGKKKIPGDLKRIWNFITQEAQNCQVAVLSAEMLFYGGLLPSRIHHLDAAWIKSCIQRIKELKEKNPCLKLYMFQLIMRTPRYNSGDEEPDYYEIYGERIFKRAYLLDKAECHGLSGQEQQELEAYQQELPAEVIHDYETRRAFNLSCNILVLQLVKEGVIDFLCVPQDDSCEYGYTARDQKRVGQEIRRLRIQRKVLLYPGADEAGCTLTARAVMDFSGARPKIYPFYASVSGKNIIPLYEDRCMGESLKSHVMAAGGILVDTPEEANFILAVNCPGQTMIESWEQEKADFTYQGFRNLNWFAAETARYIACGKKVLLADCAYANGGDLELLELLDSYEVLDKLISYKGWNTHCNTLGSTLAQGILTFDAEVDQNRIQRNLMYHILDDGCYQAHVRMQMTAQFAGTDLTYFDLKDRQLEVVHMEKEQISLLWDQLIQKTFRDIKKTEWTVYHPWNRMFEIGMILQTAHSQES